MQLALRRLALVALLLTGCQGGSTPAPASRAAVPSDGVLAAEALERGEYAKAAELYQRGLAAGPESLALHYGLGVSASYLSQRGLAVREMTWVVEHGEAASNEVKVARRWLLSVGVLPRTATAEASAPAPAEPSDQEPAPRPAVVHGRTMFGDSPGTVVPMVRMMLILKEYPSQVNYFRLRTDEQGYFHFQDVPPGIYQLTDKVAGQPTWRLRVEVKPGEDMALDLTPENSTKFRNDFPDLTTSLGARAP